jgi:hypothetical protein
MPRAYVDVSKFRTPFNYPNLTLTGLGEEPLRASWPPGRSYVDVSRYRAPYLDYQFQDNTLFGLGAAAAGPAAAPVRCLKVRGKVTPKAPDGVHIVCPWDPGYELARLRLADSAVSLRPIPLSRSTKQPVAGMGAVTDAPLPADLQRYLQTGAPMGTLKRDLGSALAQVPALAWGAGALVAGFIAYKAWKAA